MDMEMILHWIRLIELVKMCFEMDIYSDIW